MKEALALVLTVVVLPAAAFASFVAWAWGGLFDETTQMYIGLAAFLPVVGFAVQVARNHAWWPWLVLSVAAYSLWRVVAYITMHDSR